MIPAISVHELKERRDSHAQHLLLDIRTAEERAFASIGGVHIDMYDLADRLDELEPHRGEEIVVYCRSGQRSASVVAFLLGNGFDQAVNLQGGILAWSSDVDPTVPPY